MSSNPKTPASQLAKHILIIGPSWVGDMVMAQSLFKVLKAENPGVTIDVLAPQWSLPILARMPEVRHGIVMKVGHGRLGLRTRLSISRSLRSEKYDQAIALPNAFKSALIPIFARIPKRTGWRGEMRYGLLNDIRLLNKARYPLMVERFVALAFEEGRRLPKHIPKPELCINPENRQLAREQFKLFDDAPILALCPGAEFGGAKRWPENYYAQVAQAYIDKGYQVCLFGSANDQPVTNDIRNFITQSDREKCIDLAGQTTLAEAVDLLSLADLVVSNDSGLMHVAAALQRPLVVVYGSTSPDFTPPLADRVAVLFEPVDCGPCFQRDCPKSQTEERLKCLLDLQPQRVLSALASLSESDAVKITVASSKEKKQ